MPIGPIYTAFDNLCACGPSSEHSFTLHFSSLFVSFIFLIFLLFFHFSLFFIFRFIFSVPSLCQAFPFAFYFMSKKSQAAYEHLFNYIEQNIFQLSTVVSFTTDYETAMRNALVKVNPNARMVACHFHYCQALKRRASQTDGFVTLIKINKEAESIYYRLMDLPLLPAEFIPDISEELQREAFHLNKRGFKQFFTYFRREWINKVKCFLSTL